MYIVNILLELTNNLQIAFPRTHWIWISFVSGKKKLFCINNNNYWNNKCWIHLPVFIWHIYHPLSSSSTSLICKYQDRWSLCVKLIRWFCVIKLWCIDKIVCVSTRTQATLLRNWNYIEFIYFCLTQIEKKLLFIQSFGIYC